MRWIRICGRVLLGFVAVQWLACAGSLPAQELTRAFPNQKCRYTLPDANWQWEAVDDPEKLFEASHPDGVNISLLAIPGAADVDDAFMKAFETSYFAQIQKRDGKLLTYVGQPCYEGKGRIGETTNVTRAFSAHGYIYTMTVVGGVQPVEDTPQFQQLMEGLEFTSPPAIKPRHAPGSDEETAYLIGTVIGAVCVLGFFGLMGGLVFWLVLRATRNDNQQARKSKPSRPESIFLEDED